MNHRRPIILLLAAVFLLGACSAADESSTDAGGSVDGEVATQGSVERGADGGDAVAPDETAARGQGEEGEQPLSVGAPLGRKVIQRANLTLEVDDPATAVDEITSLAERSGGFVAGADLQRTGHDNELRGTITLRIPTSELSNTIQRLKALAVRVPEQHLGTQDVTEEYSDVTAQLRNLRALETELVALLADVRAQSNSADEILVVFERIRQVRGEIERLEGRKQVLDDLVALATVEVRVEPTETAIAVAEEGWRPGDTLAAALRTTVGALQTIVDAAIWVAVTVVPIALLLLLPVVGLAYGVRRWRRQPGSAAPSA